MKTGRLTLKPFSIVSEVLYDRDRKRATGVRVHRRRHEPDDGLQGARRLPLRVDAQLDVAAHAIGHRCLAGRTRQQLRRARSQSHGPSLPVRRAGKLEGLEDKYYYGRRPTGFYIPRYRNLFGDKRAYLRGFGYQGGAGRDGWSRAVAELGVGAAFKDATTEPGRWGVGATAFGEMLPNHDEQGDRSTTMKKDKWGLPVLKIDCATGENERLMRKDMINDMAELLEQCGVKEVKTYDNDYFPGMGIHEMGTARMGRIRSRRCSTRGTRCGMRRTSS